MRDILFRGKKKTTGKWVYGNLIHVDDYCCVLEREEDIHEMDTPYLDSEIGWIDGQAAPVIPETVGQFTGLFDRNGKMIFEGDVIKDEYGITKSVKFYRGYYCPFVAFPDYRCWDESRCEVIGTVHDNPELLEAK